MAPEHIDYNQTEYCRFALNQNRDDLVLVFSHMEEPAGRFSLQRTMAAIGASAVLTNTPRRSYYALGVPGLGGTIDETVAALRRIVAARRPRTVATVGISMGAYAALLFGALLRAERILALSPETLLLLPGSRSRGALNGRVEHPYPDLLPMLQQAPQARIAVYFGETDLHDVHAAWRLRGLPRIGLYSVQDAGHEVGRWFADRGLLDSLIDGFVHRGEPLQDFPGRGAVLQHGTAIDLAMTAHTLLFERKPIEAIAVARRATRLAPGFDLAHDGLGRALAEAGRFREAVHAYRCAAELAPECDLYRVHYGRALLDAGDPPAAERVLREVVRDNPKMALAHHYLGLVAERRGDRPAAEAAHRQAIACNGSNAAFFHHLGALQMALGRWQEAEQSYRRAVELNDTQAPLHDRLGSVLFAQGRAADAVACFRRAVGLDPGNAAYVRHLRRAAQEPGRVGRPAAPATVTQSSL